MLNYVQLFRIMMIFMILLHITLDITSLIVENNFPSWHQLHVKEAMSNNTLVSHPLLFKLMTRYWWIFYSIIKSLLPRIVVAISVTFLDIFPKEKKRRKGNYSFENLVGGVLITNVRHFTLNIFRQFLKWNIFTSVSEGSNQQEHPLIHNTNNRDWFG